MTDQPNTGISNSPLTNTSEVNDITNDDFRPCLIGNRYQAQIMCPGCKGWVMTKNLRAYKENEILFAEAFGLVCEKKGGEPCGHEFGDIRLVGWSHSAPIDWRPKDAA